MKIARKINKEIDVYKNIINPKEHEKKLIEIIESENNITDQEILDVGCASGNFLNLIREKFDKVKLHGFDISEELISLANKRKLDNCNFFLSDISNFKSSIRYDIIIASGVMSLFDNFSEPLDNWLSHLKSKGKLYIFGRFNTQDVDTIIHHKNNYHDNAEWTGGFTSYSIKTVSKFLDNKEFEHKFYRFHLETNLSIDENPIKTFSIVTENGEKIIMNGANIVAEHYFLSITKN
tara:strand:- start:430 stop:1134 length:705 start_codon:yes stop_codon:yes gene_type:complete